MNGASEVSLAIIAAAVVTMTIVQIGVIVAAGLLARRISRLADRMERELKPLFAHLDSIGRDASRAVSIAAAQVDRADKMLADITGRVDRTLDGVQASLAVPAREWRALMAGLRAVLEALRTGARNPRHPGRGEDEDALFI